MLLLAGHDSIGVPCCCGFFLLAIFAFFVILSNIKGTGTRKAFDQIRKNGTPALGIILRVDNTGTTSQGPATTFSATSAAGGYMVVRDSLHSRNAVIDIEIPGQRPYEVSISVLMPLNMADDVLPGATVELRVDPKDKRNVIIVGPGSGFSGFAQIPVTFQQDGST